MNLQEENLNLQEENAQPTEITKRFPPFFPTKGGLELKTLDGKNGSSNITPTC